MSEVLVEDEIISALKAGTEERLSFFPFSAVVGANTAKKALLLVLVNPAVGPLLLHGEREVGKSTLLSSVHNLIPSIPVFSINYTTPENMIFHGANSVVERVSGGFLLVERINIMEPKTAQRIMAASKQFLFTLLATMNDEDAPLDRKIADMFLMVRVPRVSDLEERIEVIKRVREFRENPQAFSSRFPAEKRISQRIEGARRTVQRVQIDSRVLSEVKKTVKKTGMDDEQLLELLKANAALDERTWASVEDMEDILPLFFRG